MKLMRNIGSLITVRHTSTERGNCGLAMNDLGIIHNAAMIFSDIIVWIGPNDAIPTSYHIEESIDAKGACIMPGFVDSHTHCVFAGSRSHEFSRRLQGVSYQQIASEGGGILHTVNSVRNASVEQLAEQGIVLAKSALRNGTTTIEMKSGYGLSIESELNLLRAIAVVQNEVSMRIVSTFLGAHDIPPEFRDNREAYIEIIINEMLPKVKEEQLAVFCDVFSDTGYFTIEESERILHAASDLGFSLKVHADELSSFGAAEMASRMGAISADHLLFCSEQGMEMMKASGTVATLLPGTAYTLHLPYAPATRMIKKGLIVGLATDCNPGSCFTENMQMILSLACTNMRMSVEQAITAATLHGAYALGLEAQCGSLEIGKSADFIVLSTTEYPDLVYHFGVNHISQSWFKGNIV